MLSFNHKDCQLIGFSRNTFYPYHAAKDEDGVEAFDKNRRKPNLTNRGDPAIETAVIAFASEYPAYAPTKASNELRKQTEARRAIKRLRIIAGILIIDRLAACLLFSF